MSLNYGKHLDSQYCNNKDYQKLKKNSKDKLEMTIALAKEMSELQKKGIKPEQEKNQKLNELVNLIEKAEISENESIKQFSEQYIEDCKNSQELNPIKAVIQVFIPLAILWFGQNKIEKVFENLGFIKKPSPEEEKKNYFQKIFAMGKKIFTNPAKGIEEAVRSPVLFSSITTPALSFIAKKILDQIFPDEKIDIPPQEDVADSLKRFLNPDLYNDNPETDPEEQLMSDVIQG